MKRYPAYRPSGVEWLGEVPEGWEVQYLKRLCHVFPSNVDKHTHPEEIPVRLCNYTDVYYNDRIDSSLEFMAASATQDEIDKFALRVGDVIFTKDSETADDIGIAAIVAEELPGVICGYHLSIARPNADVDGRYVKAFFDSAAAKAHFEVSANGLTRVGLGQYAIDNLPIPFPPLPEQQAIARFLDREVAKLDDLVAEQRRLIALLAEKRQAVISHAVTRGLNPTAPLKPSGIDWLGDIPEGWEVVRLANVFRDVAEPGNDDLPILSVSIHTGVSDDELAEEDLDRKVTRSDDKSKYVTVRPGDLTYNMMRAWQGGFGAVKVMGMVSPAYVVARPIDAEQVQTEFIELLLRTQNAVSEMKRHSRGVTDFRLRLYWEEFRTISVALPSKAEQVEILKAIEEQTQKFDSLTAAATSAIDLLQERRAALISAAVTGKIDVRHALPEQEPA